MLKTRINVIMVAAVLLMTGCGVRKNAENVVKKNSSSAEKTAVTADIQADAAVVSYLGPEGTYTQEACGKFFGGKGGYEPYETVTDAVAALAEGKSNYAVIPQENTIGGAVTDYVDILISQADASVVGEVELPINQNLLTIKGTELSDIKTVYSHKQGIAQGKEWLEKNLPDAEVIEVSSTAEGAKMVSEKGDKSCAAIASAACADVYGLEVSAAAIQNNDSNKTRFYVLSMQQPATADAGRTAFIASGKAELLSGIMSDIKSMGIKLVAVHDRPLKTQLGEYAYVIECAGCSYSQYSKLAENSSMDMRFLGCFDVK
ncbi:prephenate dehydratase domain-containing protein [uncultured Ruminococcus sp.]|uniref:prephenate dehydratase n=1 Tax=uncultured Ruminococcus sp. TaxID=165186 RepID=UPI000EEDBF0B|nr:prephenate dehydratase domain-containing protein [uncultured Ruminococcus sp.]HCJ40505.1 hypothetical protein [Ruminococcus sp.]